MVNESAFQSKLIKELRTIFPGCFVLLNDPNYIQGFPDILILFEEKWAALESKQYEGAPRQPNQEWYINVLGSMSYANIIYPENKERVLNELQQSFRARGSTRISRSE
jgi:hypothetical protein